MNLIEYIAKENPEGLRSTLIFFGINASTMSLAQMAEAADKLFVETPTAFYSKLFEVHPDIEILSNTDEKAPIMENNCIFNKLPEPIKQFYSGEYKTLKIIATVVLAVIIIRKL
jgi:hypothetical protein